MNFDNLKNLTSSENMEHLKEKAGDIKEKVVETAHTVAEKAGELGKKFENNETVRNLSEKAAAGAQKVKEIAERLPGVAVDKADDNKVDPKLVKQDVKHLNNDPASDQTPVV